MLRDQGAHSIDCFWGGNGGDRTFFKKVGFEFRNVEIFGNLSERYFTKANGPDGISYGNSYGISYGIGSEEIETA